MVKSFKSFKEFSGGNEATQEELKEFAPVADDKIPAIFATIHHRSEDRPDGYLPEDISWLNVIANKHIPELYAELLAAHQAEFPNHKPEGTDEG